MNRAGTALAAEPDRAAGTSTPRRQRKETESTPVGSVLPASALPLQISTSTRAARVRRRGAPSAA